MTTDTLIGQHLDEYRLDALLGQGGMARVYRGLDVRLKRWVAIKVIDTPFRTDADYTMRFEREAQAIAQLEHPHIVRLYRYGEANGLLYIAMQYVEGAPLSQVLATYREDGEFIEPPEVSRIVREVGLALDYAHTNGVIHRDVKPANIILNRQGQAILTDFGLVLLTEVGTRGEIFGTPHYIAPEQAISSAGAVPQSDLYSLGVMLYEMFTGEVPFDAPQPLDVAMLHMVEPPPPPSQFRPDLNPKLEMMILKALAKEPNDRYPSGASLADALDKALQTVPVKAPPPTDPVLLTIPERVAVSIAKRPLPPLPTGVSDQLVPPAAPKLPPQPAQIDQKSDQPVPSLPQAAAPAAPAPASQRSFIFIGVGIGLMLSLVLILVVLLLGLFLWLRVGNEGAANLSTLGAVTPGPVEGEATPVVSPLAEASPTAELLTLIPTPPQVETAGLAQTPAPPLSSPAPSPLPEPRLITDSAEDFSAVPGIWTYLVYKPKENRFELMNFEQRKYGQCWYGQDYIRICLDSGHPGNSADVVWRWTSQIDGRMHVRLWAHKIDLGGDGVTIRAYHNGHEVQGQQISGRDAEGVGQKNWFEVEVKTGDTLAFMMQKNGNAQNDHTFFVVQIYQQ